jgi:4-hydroxybenzoate polyprenyltransferase
MTLVLLLELVRIRSWKAYLGMAFFGYALPIRQVDLLNLFPMLVSVSLYLGFAFAINNCYDVDTDIVSGKKINPVASGAMGEKRAKMISYAIAASGLLFTWTSLRDGFVIYSLMTLLAYAYSAPPRLKGLPAFDMISHGLFFGSLLFLFGASVSGSLSSEHAVLASSVFLYSCLFELKNHIEDFEHDRRAGIKTTAVRLGERRKTAFSMLCAVHILLLIFLVSQKGSAMLYFPALSGLAIMMPEDWLFNNFRAVNLFTILVYAVHIVI